MNTNNEELFNEKEFEEANNGLQHIQKYNENEEAISLFLDMFSPSEELVELIWKAFGESIIVVLLLSDDEMIAKLSEIKDHYDLLDPPFDFVFLARTAMEINNSEFSEKIIAALDAEKSFTKGVLNSIIFQHGADQS